MSLPSVNSPVTAFLCALIAHYVGNESTVNCVHMYDVMLMKTCCVRAWARGSSPNNVASMLRDSGHQVPGTASQRAIRQY